MYFKKYWRTIPASLKLRQKEIMGEIKNNLMQDCVYNSLIAGELAPTPPLTNGEQMCRQFLPADFKLKPYQQQDLNSILGRRYVFNINKPGYGKTLETILWIRAVLGNNFKVLILCPKTTVETTWMNQLNKYWPGWSKDGFWWITNYEQLYDETRFKLACDFDWDAVIIDESHKIKSFQSQITERVFKLKAGAKHCLTGTPVKNRPEDLAAQLKWLDVSSITNYSDFRECFCEKKKDAWGVKYIGLTKNQTMINNLQTLLAYYCVGGEEHDVGLGDKPQPIKVRLKLPKDVKALYQKVVGEYDDQLKQTIIDTGGLLDQGIKVSNQIESAIRRQQLASNPELFNASLTNIKFEWILEWLQGCEEKVVIMSKFAKTIDYLEAYLKKARIKLTTIRRSQAAHARAVSIEIWKKNSQVLLGTFGVLATGTDGLQDVCRYGIHVDRNWNNSDNDQAERRLYRTGGGKVTTYILQAIGTIDIQIERVQWKKGQDTSKLLDFVEDDCE